MVGWSPSKTDCGLQNLRAKGEAISSSEETVFVADSGRVCSLSNKAECLIDCRMKASLMRCQLELRLARLRFQKSLQPTGIDPVSNWNSKLVTLGVKLGV